MDGRIDAHQHFWCYDQQHYAWIDPDGELACDHGPDDLKGELDRVGIAHSIAVQARQSEYETRWLLDRAARFPWIAGVFGWIDLRAPDVATRLAEWAGEPRLVDFRHVVQDEPDPRFLLDLSFQRGVREVLDAGFAYDLLVRAPQLEHVPAFLDAAGVGDGRAIVIDHGTKPGIAAGEWQPWAGRMAAIARDYPVFCKLSGLVTEAEHAAWQEADVLRYMEHLLDCFGPDRLIYGSDWPVCLLAAPYARVHALAQRLLEPLAPAARDAVMGGNARRAYARIEMKIQGEIIQ